MSSDGGLTADYAQVKVDLQGPFPTTFWSVRGANSATLCRQISLTGRPVKLHVEETHATIRQLSDVLTQCCREECDGQVAVLINTVKAGESSFEGSE